MSPEFQLGFYSELMKIAQEIQTGPPVMNTPAVMPKPSPAGPTVPAVAKVQRAGTNAMQPPSGTGTMGMAGAM